MMTMMTTDAVITENMMMMTITMMTTNGKMTATMRILNVTKEKL